MKTPKEILEAYANDYHRNMEEVSVTYNKAEDGLRKPRVDLCGYEEYHAIKSIQHDK